MSYEDAVSLFNKRSFKKCIQVLRDWEKSIQSQHPHRQQLCYRLLGDASRAAERFDDAIVAYQRCIDITGDAADYCRLAFAYRENGNDEAAVAAVKRAVELRPKDPDILADAGGIYVALGDLRQGIKSYKKALQTSAPSPSGATGVSLPRAQARADRYKNVRVAYWLGLAYNKLGKKRRARGAFETALANADPSTDSDFIGWINNELAAP